MKKVSFRYMQFSFRLRKNILASKFLLNLKENFFFALLLLLLKDKSFPIVSNQVF